MIINYRKIVKHITKTFGINIGDVNEKGRDENYYQNDRTKDSLKKYSITYSRYKNFVEQITDKEWNYIGDVQTCSMNNEDNICKNMVCTYLVEKGMSGTFLEIISLPYHMMTICGFDDAGIDPMEFYSHSNLYKIPHFFSMMCTDDHGKELSRDTMIDITKITSNGKHKKLCSEPYGNLSQHIDGRFRRKEERYYFSVSIKLENNERLLFCANNPDIDIINTKLLMSADIFVKNI